MIPHRPVTIREPRDGVWYFADPGAEKVSYKGNSYEVVLWRDTLSQARSMAKTLSRQLHWATEVHQPGFGKVTIPHIVRKIKLHAGKALNGTMKKHTIVVYGIYKKRK